MIKELFEILEEKNLTISAAESITGGKFSSLIVSEPGASKIFKGSFICYSNEYKYNVLKVSKDIEIVSYQMAMELAENSREIANSEISISFTGNSSSDGIESKNKGESYVAISSENQMEVIKFQSLKKDRIEIIEETANFGLGLLLRFIRQHYK